MQRRFAAIVRGVDVVAEVDQHLHGFESLRLGVGRGAAIFTGIPHVHTGRDHQRCRVIGVGRQRVRAGREQDLHHLGVDVLGRQEKRGGADAVEAVPVAIAEVLVITALTSAPPASSFLMRSSELIVPLPIGGGRKPMFVRRMRVV